jgi:hypothetical protein
MHIGPVRRHRRRGHAIGLILQRIMRRDGAEVPLPWLRDVIQRAVCHAMPRHVTAVAGGGPAHARRQPLSLRRV